MFWQTNKDLLRQIILASHTFLAKNISQCHCAGYYQKPGKVSTGLCNLWVRTGLVLLEGKGAVPPWGWQLMKAEQDQEPCLDPVSTISGEGSQAVAQQLSPLAHPQEVDREQRWVERWNPNIPQLFPSLLPDKQRAARQTWDRCTPRTVGAEQIGPHQIGHKASIHPWEFWYHIKPWV